MSAKKELFMFITKIVYLILMISLMILWIFSAFEAFQDANLQEEYNKKNIQNDKDKHESNAFYVRIKGNLITS